MESQSKDKNLTDKICTIKIELKDEGLRLDQFLATTDLVKNRSQGLKLILENRIRCNKKNLKASHKLKIDEVLEISLPPEQDNALPAYDIPLDIVYEDEDVIVVNKPAGLVVHPAPGHKSDTLVNALLPHTKLSSGTSALRPGLVHRLDKDTSGLLVLSKTKEAENNLIQQFKERSVTRIYWALTLKTPQPVEGVIESFLCRHPISRQKFISIKKFKEGSKKAITHYKILKQHNNDMAWLECRLNTGRTHQIRVHLSSMGCPILGDIFYSKKKSKNKSLQNTIENLTGIALHAHNLSFKHPVTQKMMNFQCDWHTDLQKLLVEMGFKIN